MRRLRAALLVRNAEFSSLLLSRIASASASASFPGDARTGPHTPHASLLLAARSRLAPVAVAVISCRVVSCRVVSMLSTRRKAFARLSTSCSRIRVRRTRPLVAIPALLFVLCCAALLCALLSRTLPRSISKRTLHLCAEGKSLEDMIHVAELCIELLQQNDEHYSEVRSYQYQCLSSAFSLSYASVAELYTLVCAAGCRT